MALVALLYFENEKTLYFDLTKSRMQNTVSQISNEIILSHMTGTKFERKKYLESKNYEISFYNYDRKKLFGTLDEKINFSQKNIITDDFIILIDNSTVGHLGIDYIAIKDNSFSKKISELKVSIIFLFLLSFIFISIVGFYLAKLFIKPIKDERNKLNNFIKDTTHELNTPISAILMSTENETLTPKQTQRVKLSAKRVSEIYKDLTYIFMEKDIKKSKLKKLFLNEIIKEQLSYFEPLASKKRIKISLDISEFSYKIDKDDFIRLFNNLVSNAIKYNKINGNIEILLKKEGELIVKDSGIGIKKEKINDIFKRYYRATEIQGGFGIGLNIVYEITKKYNIKIDVNSQEKIETTFKLKF